MNISRLKWLLVIIVVMGLIIEVGYLMLPYSTPHKDKLEESGWKMEVSEKGAIKTHGEDIRREWSEDELKINAKLPFKVGDKFEYKNIGKDSDVNHIYIVEEVERIDGRDYYPIRTIAWGKQREFGDKWMEIPKTEGSIWLYYDRESGQAFETKDGKLKSLGSDSRKGLLIEYWMLALNDDFKWERKLNISGLGLDSENKYVYSVLGREKIKGRKCFKVERIFMEIKGKNIKERYIFYVDVETRILVNGVKYIDDVKRYEDMLISAPFPLKR